MKLPRWLRWSRWSLNAADSANGQYQFLSWARRGIALSIVSPDPWPDAPPDHARGTIQLTLVAKQGNTTNTTQTGPVSVELFGPGDIRGLDERVTIRTEPPDSTMTFEPNYLCAIEFDAWDLPWLATPCGPMHRGDTTNPITDRLRPWLVLIALKPDEFGDIAGSVVPVKNVAALPPLSDSWNWVHVQVSGDKSLAEADKIPGSVISRLLCPRHLDPNTQYTAFLVPAFDISVQAGLGRDVSDINTSAPAWTKDSPTPLNLPFYYKFQFHTATEGDFDSLVRRLKVTLLDSLGKIGLRPMDVSQPAPDMPNFPPAATGPLGLEGALRAPGTLSTPWDDSDADKKNFQTRTQDWINQTLPIRDDPAKPNPSDPFIAPPIYGRWHAAVRSVRRGSKGWITDLNLDPRNRAAAGMGTQVVLGELTQLMFSAWQQVDGVRAANELLNRAQLARATLQQVYNQHLQPAAAETLMNLTAPLHARLRADLDTPGTIHSAVRKSLVPERMLSPAFRKATRPRRRIGPAVATRPPLLSRINSGEATFMPPPKPPHGLVSIDKITKQRMEHWAKELLELLALINQSRRSSKSFSRRLFLSIMTALVGVAVGAGWISAEVWEKIEELLHIGGGAKDLVLSHFTPQIVKRIPPRPDFVVTLAGERAPSIAPTHGEDSADAKAFRSATGDIFGVVASHPKDPPARPQLDVSRLNDTLLTRLNPSVTVVNRLQALVKLSPLISWKPDDPLEPIMAAPEFPAPLYVQLRDLSPQNILPGVELVPPDSVGLLQANHTFIEAFMVGANWEMGRQLLWNDYPCDQRGSYFRQFWDVSTYLPPAGTPSGQDLADLLKDIPPIHTWKRSSPLGQNKSKFDIVSDSVVLLIRGEVFKRYPQTTVYAGKAKCQNGKRVLDASDERHPIFRATLPPDITLLGFNLSLADARGGTAASPDGFFFVFQQDPTLVRFGLEPAIVCDPGTTDCDVGHWSDLAWTNFPNAADASKIYFLSSADHYIKVKLDTNPTDPGYNPNDADNDWGVNSAQTAYILRRVPFRVLIHADLLLSQGAQCNNGAVCRAGG